MAAAAAMTFLNNLGAPLPTPANLAALSGLARVLHEFGCREKPSVFDFRNLMSVLDQRNVIERAVWLVASLNGGVLKLDANFREDSAMHDGQWPGYPPRWISLWKGQLWDYVKRHYPLIKVSRLLMRAGVSELANVCTTEGDSFLSWFGLTQACPHVVDVAPSRVKAEYEQFVEAMVASGVQPLQGRCAWAAADAAVGLKPEYAGERASGDETGLMVSHPAHWSRQSQPGRSSRALCGRCGCSSARRSGWRP
jgi:hypothetical protein